MKINHFITLLLSLTLLFACDDESSEESGESTQETVSAGSETENSDMDVPVQMMDFDTIEIEPDSEIAGTDVDMD